YESSSLLRVEPAKGNLFSAGTEAEVFDHFLQTQVELIRSPSVVSRALAAGGTRVTGTALLRDAVDPESELRGRLHVGVLPGTYLIRVGVTTPDPADGPAIISEVVKAYLAMALNWSSEKNGSQIKRLENYNLVLTGKITEQQNEWIRLAQKAMVELQAT